ncbi:MAG: DUF2914 domain-containing protein, partial [Myxococcota bacterium]|nr:DUF2914 domain-containing protein [Myxococcota bacterium]
PPSSSSPRFYLSRTVHGLATLVRGVAVAFLLVPGAGLGLVAAACGDVIVAPAQDDTHQSDQVVERIHVNPPAVATTEPVAPPVAEAPVLPAHEPMLTPSLIETAHGDDDTLGESADEPIFDDADDEDCANSSRLEIVDAALALGVERRKPVQAGENFRLGEKVWAWVSVRNPDPQAEITMVWKRDGVVRSRMTLNVGKSPRWRTWSRYTLRPTDEGLWTVEVLDAEGNLLHVMGFKTLAADAEVQVVLGC